MTRVETNAREQLEAFLSMGNRREDNPARIVGEAYARAVATGNAVPFSWTNDRGDRTSGPNTTEGTVDAGGIVRWRSGYDLRGREGQYTTRRVTIEEVRFSGMSPSVSVNPSEAVPMSPPGTPWESRRMGFTLDVDTVGDGITATSVLAFAWGGYLLGEKTGRIFQGTILGVALGYMIGRSMERTFMRRVNAKRVPRSMNENDLRDAAVKAERGLEGTSIYANRVEPAQRQTTGGDGRGPGSGATNGTGTLQLIKRA